MQVSKSASAKIACNTQKRQSSQNLPAGAAKRRAIPVANETVRPCLHCLIVEWKDVACVTHVQAQSSSFIENMAPAMSEREAEHEAGGISVVYCPPYAPFCLSCLFLKKASLFRLRTHHAAGGSLTASADNHSYKACP